LVKRKRPTVLVGLDDLAGVLALWRRGGFRKAKRNGGKGAGRGVIRIQVGNGGRHLLRQIT
jgi:hypothetical protein